VTFRPLNSNSSNILRAPSSNRSLIQGWENPTPFSPALQCFHLSPEAACAESNSPSSRSSSPRLSPPLAIPLLAQGAPPQSAAGQPYAIEYYYKCQWGHQQEFLSLFLKNHYPLLKKIQSTGRILSVKIESPAYHTTEDGRWDYRVTIVYKDSTAATTTNPDEDAFIKQLWPDQETYQREEQRRFEILLGHWDLPVTDITPAN
jgi:hypothetical protein